VIWVDDDLGREEMEKILIVDDDDLNRELLATMLTADYEVLEAESGEIAIELARKQVPDMILLDIQMPGIDGYQTCQQLKQDQGTENCPVIFISANESEEEIIKGYEVGAVDYLVKPLKPNELQQKIRRILDLVRHKKEWEEKYNKAGSTAGSDAGVYARISRFLSDMLSSENYDALAGHFIDIVNDQGMNSTLQIREKDSNLMYSSSSSSSAMEEKVILLASTRGRMVDYGKRMIVNGRHCSILVKNMPLDSGDEYDALRNFTSLICDGLDSRIDCMKMEAANVWRSRQFLRVLRFVLDYLRAIRDGSDELHRESVHIVENMCENLGLSIGEIVKVNDLTDGIEKRIVDVGNDCLNEIDSFLSDGLKFTGQVGELIGFFDKTLAQDNLSEEDYAGLTESLDKVDIYKFKRDCKRRRGQ